MSIDSISGVISWKPSAEGNYAVTVQVSDGKGGTNSQSYNLVVSALPSNRAPSITSTAVTTGRVGVAYSYDVNASDPNGDKLIYL